MFIRCFSDSCGNYSSFPLNRYDTVQEETSKHVGEGLLVKVCKDRDAERESTEERMGIHQCPSRQREAALSVGLHCCL